MHTIKHTIIRYLSVANILICTLPVFAADQVTPDQYSSPWWHEAHGHSFWWVFPLMFFVMMIVICIFVMRGGCMGCKWRNWMTEKPEYRDDIKRDSGESSESALEILDKRYARGEIESQEYEEKKAAISRSS